MAQSLIITTQWWIDACAVQAWPLLSQTGRWPQWWPAVSTTAHAPSAPHRHLPWRALLALPLRLGVERQSMQAPELLTLTLRGDLHGSASFMLEDARTRGLHITCRLELAGTGGVRPMRTLLALVFERRLLALLQSLATHLGRALHGRVELRGQWQGSSRHP